MIGQALIYGYSRISSGMVDFFLSYAHELSSLQFLVIQVVLEISPTLLQYAEYVVNILPFTYYPNASHSFFYASSNRPLVNTTLLYSRIFTLGLIIPWVYLYEEEEVTFLLTKDKRYSFLCQQEWDMSSPLDRLGLSNCHRPETSSGLRSHNIIYNCES